MKLLVVTILFLFFVPVCIAEPIIYDNAHIILIGNCQAIVTTDGKWHGEFYKGYLETMGASNFGFFIVCIYQNNSIVYHSIYKTKDVHTHGSIFLIDTSGTFLWTNRNRCHFIPFIYINAYAENVYLNQPETY